MPATLRQEYAQRTRQSLLDHACQLFMERGYEAASLDELVERAGMTKGALYHHFKGGKKELFEAVFEMLCRQIMEHVLEASKAGEGLWEKFLAGTSAYLDYCLQPEYRRLCLVEGRAVLDMETWCKIDAEYVARPVRVTLKRLIEKEFITPQPIELLIRAYLGLLQETAFYIIAAADTRQARVEAEALIDVFLSALQKH